MAARTVARRHSSCSWCNKIIARQDRFPVRSPECGTERHTLWRLAYGVNRARTQPVGHHDLSHRNRVWREMLEMARSLIISIDLLLIWVLYLYTDINRRSLVVVPVMLMDKYWLKLCSFCYNIMHTANRLHERSYQREALLGHDQVKQIISIWHLGFIQYG